MTGKSTVGGLIAVLVSLTVGCGGGGSSVAPTATGPLVSFRKNGSVPASQIQATYITNTAACGGYFGTAPYGSFTVANSGITTYAIRYTTSGLNGGTVTVSGLVLLPDTGAPNGLVVYTHGTSIGRLECPSSGAIPGKTGAYGEAVLAAAGFGTGGYAVAMPDFVGMHVSNYNAIVARDMIPAARALAQKIGVTVGPNLFVSGYSEGGADAMATVRLLQNSGINVTRAAPMSGAYDPLGAQIYHLLLPQSNTLTTIDDGTVYPLYYQPPTSISLMIYTLGVNYPNSGISMSAYYKPLFAEGVGNGLDGNETTEAAFKRCSVAAVAAGYLPDASGNYNISDIMVPEKFAAIENSDMTDPFVAQVAKDDQHNWQATVPLYLIALQQDTMASPLNTTNTITSMRQLGVTSATLNYYMIDAPRTGDEPFPQSHLNNEAGQVILARRFFDGGFAAVPTLADPTAPPHGRVRPRG